MKPNTQLAELKTPVKHNTLHKLAARGALGRKMVVNRTKKDHAHHLGEIKPLPESVSVKFSQ